MVKRICRPCCMRRYVLAGYLIIGAATSAAAQMLPPGGEPLPERHDKTIIGGQRPLTFERCVDVEIGNDKAFGCLNQRLRHEVDRVNPLVNTPPLDARSPDVRVGNVNEAAVRQQYGPNYGRSAIPFRPPAPNFVFPQR